MSEKVAFRAYEAEDVRPGVREFYKNNHRYQTLDFVLAKKKEYLPLAKRRMGMWEALEFLNTLVDDSDPDTDLTQIEHLMQTSGGAVRGRPASPDWFILTGLIHDLGKILVPVRRNLSGRWWVTPFRLAVPFRTKSCTPNTSPTIRTAKTRLIRPGAASMTRGAGWTRSTFPGDMTSTSTRWSRIIYRRKPCT